MINNNKILTVSYGTFSCTLEGFDDSFGTMKAIAEYFRDLSADDRYFGAEPAQPDAQMLARIAEREISRHVEAREDDGRIVLSAQSEQQRSGALSAPADAAEVPDDDVEGEKAGDAAEAVRANAPEQSETTADSANSSPEPTVVKATSEPQAVAPKAAVVGEQAASEAEDTDVAAAETTPVQEIKPEALERDIVPILPDEDVEAFFADSKPVAIDVHEDNDVDIDVPTQQDRAKADSIAEKLKRIRAVVSQQGDAAKSPDYSEDQHADPTVAPSANMDESTAQETAYDDDDQFEDEDDDTSNDVLSNTLRDLEDALDADDVAEIADDDDDYDDANEDEDDDVAAILSRLESETGTSDDVDDADELDDHDDVIALGSEDDDDDMDDNILAAMDTLEAGTGSDEADDNNLFEDEVSAEMAQSEVIEVEAPASVAGKSAAPRTRVLKVKRATLEAAIQSGRLEEYDEDEDDEAPSLRKTTVVERSSLSQEAEEALARELAELEADIEAYENVEAFDEDFDEDDIDDLDDLDDSEIGSEEEASPSADESDASRARMTGSADDDFSRLMEESKQQMDEPEAATRRDAFAHLRAAVAAKKADEAVGGSDDEEETDEAYRDDLANVVRPRRPISDGERTRTERPPEARPAPLKLVAEQRIDVGEARTVAPVRPRRVAAVPQHPVQDTGPQAEDFVNFADEMGATKLPDLLEAAAAYLSFVEGHAQFSRPQLMTKVRQVEKENFTREDSLRSFGKLLREGKIEKIKGGRFQASDQIGFKPAKRAAG